MTTKSRPMRILLAPSAFHPSRGGVEELTLQLAKQYRRQGHEASVVVHHNPADLPVRDTVEGITVHRLSFDLPGSRPRALLSYPGTLMRQLRALDEIGPRPDVVHVQCASNQVLPLTLWTSRRRLPFIITTQGEVTMDAGRVYQTSLQMRNSLRVGSRRADALTACSRRAADDAATVANGFTGCPVVPNGVDPSQWHVSPLPDSPAFAAWGRQVPQKGFDLLIEAFARVRTTLPDAVLRIGGDGPEHERLKAMAGPGVHFLGPLDRDGVQALLNESRIAVVPSRLEPFGIVGVEAMACGRGVVWSTIGGLVDATGAMGQPADPNDNVALAEAMIEAHRHPVDPGAARAHAESLSWERIGNQYLETYRSAQRDRELIA